MKRRQFFASCVTFVVAPQTLLGCTRVNTQTTVFEEFCYPFPACPVTSIFPDGGNRCGHKTSGAFVELMKVVLKQMDAMPGMAEMLSELKVPERKENHDLSEM